MADCDIINTTRDWQDIVTDIRSLASHRTTTPAKRRLLNHMIPFPRALTNIVTIFGLAISPKKRDYSVLWGLVALNIQVSAVVPDPRCECP